ncbi:MAG: 30S ribosome-binding factor RbfA [Salinivirgaceae bacterium]|nr:30S ribosome-binding factor RbfA [Salinivirgaceae bacterium]
METPKPRQNKIARLLQKELAEMLQVYAKDYMSGTLISVTSVRVSSDYSIARVYISVFPTGKAKDVLANLTKGNKEIRYQLGTRIKHQLRKVPQLAIFLDDSLDYLDNIDKLLK